MAERFNATVLKTVIPKGIGGSNPPLSARILWMILAVGFVSTGIPPSVFAETASKPSSAQAEKGKLEVLKDIYYYLNQLEPAEIEKATGLRQVIENGTAKYYSKDWLLEDLDIKVLEILNGQLEQAMKQHNLEEVRESEERRKALEEMMDARRLADENNDRWRS